MNVKSIFSTFNEWVGGLVDTLVSFVSLGVLVQLIFG